MGLEDVGIENCIHIILLTFKCEETLIKDEDSRNLEVLVSRNIPLKLTSFAFAFNDKFFPWGSNDNT